MIQLHQHYHIGGNVFLCLVVISRRMSESRAREMINNTTCSADITNYSFEIRLSMRMTRPGQHSTFLSMNHEGEDLVVTFVTQLHVYLLLSSVGDK